MYLKLFIRFLVLLFLCNSGGYAVENNDRVASVNKLVNNNWKWKKFDMKIIDQGETIDIDMILKTKIPSDEMADEVAGEKLRRLSLILSCKYSNVIREFILNAHSFTKKCLTDHNLDCTLAVLEIVVKADSMLVYMLISLTWFHHVSPTFTGYKSLYGALMAFKLFTELERNKKDSFVNGEGNTDSEKIHFKLGMLTRTLQNIANQVQTFSLHSCLYKEHNPKSKIDPYRKYYKIGEMMEEIMEEFTSYYNHYLGIPYSAEPCTITTLLDIGLIWEALQSQQPAGQNINVLLFGKITDVNKIVAEFEPQDKSLKLSALQAAPLQTTTDVLHKKLLETVELSLNMRIDDRLCPDNFINTLRNHWSKLTRVDLIKIKDACPSIRKTIDEDSCVDDFFNKLKSKWLDFTQIDKSAIKAACSSIFSSHRVELADNLKNSFRNLPSSESKMTRECFWEKLLQILKKTNVLRLPAEFRKTLVILDTFITDAMQNSRLDEAEKDVIGLLEIGLKHVSTDLADETAESVADALSSLNRFVNCLVDVQPSIAIVSESNELLKNTGHVDRNEIVTNVNDSAAAMCNITKKVIDFFTYYGDYLQECYRKLPFEEVQPTFENWKNDFPALQRYLFELMESSKKVENMNIRNAILLMSLQLNDAVKVFNFYSNDTKSAVYPSRFRELAVLLILHQLEKYVLNNCGDPTFYTDVSQITIHKKNDGDERKPIDILLSDIISLVPKTDTSASLFSDANCSLTIEDALYTSLIVEEQRPESPLAIIKLVPFSWNGEVKQLFFIRNAVIENIDPIAFASYQHLIPYAVTSVMFSYMLNFTVAIDTLNLTDDDIAILLQKVEHFITVVFPLSENRAVNYICHLFSWFLKLNNHTIEKTNVLKVKIIEQVTQFGISFSQLLVILQDNKILYDIRKNPERSYVTAMTSFVDEFLKSYEEQFKCVAKYMTLKL